MHPKKKKRLLEKEKGKYDVEVKSLDSNIYDWNSSHKPCYGRGFIGRTLSGKPVACSCVTLKKVDKK
jgi:hypothetical protein